MPRKKLDTMHVESTETSPIEPIITLLSSAIPSAGSEPPPTLKPASVVVNNVTISGLHGAKVTFTVENLPLNPVLTLLDTLQKK